jgi:hypothetical protein
MITLQKPTNQLAAKSTLTAPIVLKLAAQREVCLFHIVADIAFVLAMWLIYKSSHKQPKDF